MAEATKLTTLDRALLSKSEIGEAFSAFADRVNLAIAIDHSGRAGNGFFQAIFDQHDEVLTCPWMHYIYSYIETEFGDAPVLDSDRFRAFMTQRGYFRYLYNDPDVKLSAEISRFGGDPSAPLDRDTVRSVFDTIIGVKSTISRRDALLAMYFAYAMGVGRNAGLVKYVLVTDAISLRFEDTYAPFSGRVLDRVSADFPNSRIVHLVRDPRAAFASTNHQYVNSAGNMYGLHLGGFWRTVVALIHSRFDWEHVFVFGFVLIYFRQAFLAAERKALQYRGRTQRLRNEDLNLKFSESMRDICGWLGIAGLPEWDVPSYVPTMVGRPWTGTGAYNSAYQTNRFGPLRNDPDTVARNVTGPNEYVTRRWRSRLSTNEIYLIEWVLREEVELYGYECLELAPGNKGNDEFVRRLMQPLRGELPQWRWIADGWRLGVRELIDRLFYSLTFPVFYVAVRIQFYRLMTRNAAFARS